MTMSNSDARKRQQEAVTPDMVQVPGDARNEMLTKVLAAAWDQGYTDGLNDSSLAESDDGWHENPFMDDAERPVDDETTADEWMAYQDVCIHGVHMRSDCEQCEKRADETNG